MYFLLAVALWVCIAYILKSGKLRHEKSQKAQREWFDKAREDHDRFIELYAASDELLSQTRHLVYSNDDEAQAMRYRIEREAGIKSTSDMTVRALLAQSCKMSVEIERSFLTWYDKELRLHGFPYKLLFTPWHKKTEFRAGDMTAAIPVSERPEITSGVYFWEPIRAFASCGENVITQKITLPDYFLG